MKVLKQDGNRFHGIGFLPDIPVSPTLQGIRRDEILEKAIELAKEVNCWQYFYIGPEEIIKKNMGWKSESWGLHYNTNLPK